MLFVFAFLVIFRVVFYSMPWERHAFWSCFWWERERHVNERRSHYRGISHEYQDDSVSRIRVRRSRFLVFLFFFLLVFLLSMPTHVADSLSSLQCSNPDVSLHFVVFLPFQRVQVDFQSEEHFLLFFSRLVWGVRVVLESYGRDLPHHLHEVSLPYRSHLYRSLIWSYGEIFVRDFRVLFL